MKRPGLRKAGALLLVVMTMSACMPVAQAREYWGRGRGSHHRAYTVLPRGHISLTHRGDRYFYHGGLFYRNVRNRYVYSAPPIGAIISLLPLGFAMLMIAGMPYYHYEGVYYRECPSGYMVVPESEIEARRAEQNRVKEQPAVQQDAYDNGRDFTVNVPNNSGSFTAVKLTRTEAGYIGPQGEFYPDRPTVKQLQVLYGK